MRNGEMFHHEGHGFLNWAKKFRPTTKTLLCREAKKNRLNAGRLEMCVCTQAER
jgi:hypothetical protein